MLLALLHLRGGRSGLAACRWGTRGRRGLRSRCLGRQDSTYAQQRGENQFVHFGSPFASGSFPPRITILQPEAEINDSLRTGVRGTKMRGESSADLNE